MSLLPSFRYDRKRRGQLSNSISQKTIKYQGCNSSTRDDQITNYECHPHIRDSTFHDSSSVPIRCIPMSHVCNGVHDCPNGDDEARCSRPLSPTNSLPSHSSVQTTTTYALMATLCSVMLMLILVAFFVHRFRKLRCETAFRSVSFAPLIYRPVTTSLTFGYNNDNNGTSSAYPTTRGGTNPSNCHSLACQRLPRTQGTAPTNVALDRVFHPLSSYSARFAVNYNVHSNCIRFVQTQPGFDNDSTSTTGLENISPPSYLETVMNPNYVRNNPLSVVTETSVAATTHSNYMRHTTTNPLSVSAERRTPPPPYCPEWRHVDPNLPLLWIVQKSHV